MERKKELELFPFAVGNAVYRYLWLVEGGGGGTVVD